MRMGGDGVGLVLVFSCTSLSLLGAWDLACLLSELELGRKADYIGKNCFIWFSLRGTESE